jgi:alpha-1,2-mannosyltransferase
MKTVALYGGLFGLLIFHGLLLAKIHFWQYLTGSVQLWDFDIYYQTAQDAMAGLNLYQLPYMQISGPPLMVLPYVPFTWLPLNGARSVMSCVSLIAGLGTSWLLANKISSNYSLWVRVTVTLLLNTLLLLTFPARFNFITGQPNLVIMWLSCWLMVSASQPAKGLAAGLLTIIKTNYLVTFLSLFKKSKPSLAIGIWVVAAGLILSLALFNSNSFIQFVTQRGPSFATSVAVTTDVDYYNQSVRATMGRLHLGEVYPILFGLMALAGLLYVWRSGDLVSSVMTSLLISPVLWQHYIVVVYPIIILMGYRLWQVKKVSYLFLLAVLLLIAHFPKLHGHPAVLPYNLIASHYLIGLGILLFLQIKGRGRIVV